jgi:beta-lactamase superfamily II metal-dependent hydrolase
MRTCGLVLLLPLILHGTVVGAQEARQLVVRASATPCLTVRSLPKPAAAMVVCVPPGTAVTGDSSVPFWRRIRTPDGTHGWAAKKFLDFTSTVTAPPAGGGEANAIPDSAWLEIHIVDVGQGDGIWIATWDDGNPANGRFEGKNIVIDGGPDAGDAKNEFVKYLEQHAPHGADIDALIITHPHNDHYPGARGVLRHFGVCSYYDPDTPNGVDFEKFMTEVRGASCSGTPITLHRGLANLGTPSWGSELKVEFLWGGPIDPAGMGSGNTRINNASLVMKLTYGSQSVLFMGDAEGKERSGSPDTPRYAEARLLADSATAAKLKSTVLKVAHHGSESSSTMPFIRAVDPSIVIVSSGRKNFNGPFLPDNSTLHRYCAHNPNIRIYRTDQKDAAEARTTANDADGDYIVIRTNGKQTIVQAYENGKPFAVQGCAP